MCFVSDFNGRRRATFLAAEKGRHLGAIASVKNPFIDVEFINSLDEFDDDWNHEWRLQPEPAKSRKAVSPQQPKPKPAILPKPEPWKQDLNALRSDMLARKPASTEPQRKIIYVVDLLASASSNALIVRGVARRLKKNGEWGRPNFQESWIRELDRLEPSDRRILAILGGGREAGSTTAAPPAGSVVFEHPRISIPFRSRLDFLCEIAKFPALPPIEAPPELQIEPRSPDQPPHLKIRKGERSWNVQPKLQCARKEVRNAKEQRKRKDRKARFFSVHEKASEYDHQ